MWSSGHCYKHFLLEFLTVRIPTKTQKSPNSQTVYLECCFSLKMGVFHTKIIAKGEQLAFQMKHGYRSLQNSVGILTLKNSDKKKFYSIDPCYRMLSLSLGLFKILNGSSYLQLINSIFFIKVSTQNTGSNLVAT